VGAALISDATARPDRSFTVRLYLPSSYTVQAGYCRVDHDGTTQLQHFKALVKRCARITEALPIARLALLLPQRAVLASFGYRCHWTDWARQQL